MPRTSVFYGWWVVAGFSVMTLTSTGIRHAVGPFLKPITADLGLDRASMPGMSLLVPMVTWLILTRGWRTTYMLIGVGVLAIMLPICLWVIRESPESMGLGADGAPPDPGATTTSKQRVTATVAMQ